MHELTSTIVNQDHHLSPEVMGALQAKQIAAREMLDIQNEVGRASELNAEFGTERRKILSSANGPLKLDVKSADRMTEAVESHNNKVAVSLQRVADLKRQRFTEKLSDIYHQFPVVAFQEPKDPSFWWARTDPYDTAGHSMDWRADGLHISGGPKLDKWNAERHENFGATATFGISPDRIPASASGRFISSPFVELFGGVVVFAPDWDLLQGSGIASCEMYLRQTIYQLAFGMNGPAPRVIGQAVDTGAWQGGIHLQNTGYSRNKRMPGFQLIPSVSFTKSQLAPGDTLWADVEVRFDIHLKAAGALVWCDPEIILRTFQWPLVALP